MTEVNARLRYLPIAPRKVRAILSTIQNRPLMKAEALLSLLPTPIAKPLLKLIKSAEANAKHNFKLQPETLYVKSVRVDEGPPQKRMFPRARGRADVKKKRTSHIILVLSDERKEKSK